MSGKKSLRVYCITHLDGRVTGILLRTADSMFDSRPPSAWGPSEADVLAQLEAKSPARGATPADTIGRFLGE